MNWFRETFWNFRGRLDRRGFCGIYFAVGLGGWLILVILTLIRGTLSGALVPSWDQITSVAVSLVLCSLLAAPITRRMHDFGLSANPSAIIVVGVAIFGAFPSAEWIQTSWLQPVLWAPVLFLALTLFWPGSRKENRFGPPPNRSRL